jgi:hypothetical protein
MKMSDKLGSVLSQASKGRLRHDRVQEHGGKLA